MAALEADIEKTQAGDFIHATFFEENTDTMMLPNASNISASKRSSVRNVLARALKRGAHVRILVNTNIVLVFQAIPFCLELNLLCGHFCCGPDTRHNNVIMGHLHTKMWVVKHGDSTVVYHGGIDVTEGRWDTPLHDDSPERRMNGLLHGMTAYHDQMVRIVGPAVIDFERHFYLSWNDLYPPLFPLVWLTPYEWVPPPTSRSQGPGLSVQLLRTIGCKGAEQGYNLNSAPRGEYTAQDAYYKVVRKARSFLYLVDQFFTYDVAMKAVQEALPHLQAVIILTNDQTQPNLFGAERTYFQHEALKQLLKDPAQRHKVHIFSLVRTDQPDMAIYVHTKMYLADDEYVIVGSYGIERAAFTNDQEMGMGICDPGFRYVAELRRKEWAEHLQLKPDDPILDDPLTALAEWNRQADLKTRRVQHYFPKDVGKTWISDIFDAVYEADGRCDNQH